MFKAFSLFLLRRWLYLEIIFSLILSFGIISRVYTWDEKAKFKLNFDGLSC